MSTKNEPSRVLTTRRRDKQNFLQSRSYKGRSETHETGSNLSLDSADTRGYFTFVRLSGYCVRVH
jgi:hypothetical protein